MILTPIIALIPEKVEELPEITAPPELCPFVFLKPNVTVTFPPDTEHFIVFEFAAGVVEP